MNISRYETYIVAYFLLIIPLFISKYLARINLSASLKPFNLIHQMFPTDLLRTGEILGHYFDFSLKYVKLLFYAIFYVSIVNFSIFVSIRFCCINDLLHFFSKRFYVHLRKMYDLD